MARNIRDLCESAGLVRKDTLFWNIVPWRVEGDVKKAEVTSALPYLKALLTGLKQLEVIVFLGEKAWSTEPHLKGIRDFSTVLTWLPTITVYNVHKKQPVIQAAFDEVARILAG